METVRRVRAVLPEACTLLGFAGSPFTVACYMVEGSGSRDFAATRTAAYADPAFFDRLIDMLVEATIEYLASQLEAGADAVMLFDSWAGILPPPQFFAHVVGPTVQIVTELRRRFPDVKLIGFPRLAGTLAAEYVAATGVNCIGLDTGVEAAAVAATLPAGTAVQGNLDPMVLIAGGEALATETHRIRDALRGRPHIFNLGHGILPQTPPAHVADMLGILRQVS
jgi:uroporphyrinogen decarboxylase